LVNKITTAIDRKEVTAGVFLDLSKAFDTLNHEILLAKLQHYGINGLALKWIKSYLLGRKQFVQFKESRSSEQTIVCGIPQGSILGPLLFILYINDISNASTLTESLTFADDTSVFYSHSDPNYLESVMNEELQMFDVWMKCNKLSVNIKKPNYVIFKSSKKKIPHNFLFCYGNEILKLNKRTPQSF
jgi:retron-type reverse transcriptase